LEQHGIKVKDLTLTDKSLFWDILTKTIIPKRNSIAHEGVFATAAEAELALECADVLWIKVVREIGKKLGFDLDGYDFEWSDGVKGEDSYDAKDPFQ
jgi:hypothetical protein